MKKLFLSLILVGFCSEVMSGGFEPNPNAINCLLGYPEDKRTQCMHQDSVTHSNNDRSTITFNIQTIIGNQPHNSDYDIVSIKIPNIDDYVRIKIEDLIELKKASLKEELNQHQLQKNQSIFNTSTDQKKSEIQKTVKKDALKSTTLFSGATLFASLFFNLQDKIRYGLFAGSLGLGVCGYLFTRNKSEQNYVNKDQKHFDAIQNRLNDSCSSLVTNKYTKSQTEYLYENSENLGIRSSNGSTEINFNDKKNPIQFNPVGLCLLNNILNQENQNDSINCNTKYKALAEKAFEAIKKADQELENQPESFMKNALHFLAHATEEKKFPGFTLFQGNPLNEITKKEIERYATALKQRCTYNPHVCQGLAKTSLLFGGVMTAWALDLKTGILRKGLDNLVFGK